MPYGSRDIEVSLVNLGGGEVILDQPRDALLTADRRALGPKSPYTRNLRLREGVAQTRPGYTELDTAPAANRITGLYFAIFDDGISYLVRADLNTFSKLAGGAWTDITDTTPPTGTANDYWDFAMCPRVGSVAPKNQCVAVNGVDAPFTSISGVDSDQFNVLAGSPPAGALAVGSFANRCFLANHLVSGNRNHSRITRSIAGDSADFTGLGAGSIDLNADPYPIVRLAAMAGGQVVLKGDDTGGALWRGTLTGILNEPVRYDPINPGVGVGLLLRRTFILLSPGVAFFVGHDGLYLYDGVQALKRIAEGLVTNLMSRINQDALDAAHAWYKKRTGEIHIAIPAGASETPTEVWVYNLRDNRAYGPYLYTHPITAASEYVDTGDVTWDTFDYPGGWDTISFTQWNDIAGTRGDVSIAFGTNTGEVLNDRDDRLQDDDGTAITAVYDAPTINAADRMVPGLQIPLSPTDMLTLHDVLVEYKADTTWTPIVRVSTDGGVSYATISNGTATIVGNGQLDRVPYTAHMTGKRFDIQVEGSAPYELYGIHCRFTHAGSERAG